MKKLMLSLMAAAFMLAGASLVNADCGLSHTKATSIDPSGLTVVSIEAPSHEIVKVSHDVVALDSNGLWKAYTFRDSSPDYRFASDRMNTSHNLYCFDATSKFCANAY